jgi:hypothetical protein
MKINYKICGPIVIFCALAILSLNWVLRLPALVPIIGDENTWLPIIADIIVAICSLIVGMRQQSEYDQKLRQLSEYEKNYDYLCVTLDDIHKSLRLENIIYSYILQLDEQKDVRSLYRDITSTIDSIRDCIYKSNNLKPRVITTTVFEKYDKEVKTVANAYITMLRGFLETIDKWNGFQNTLSRSDDFPQMLQFNEFHQMLKMKDECRTYLTQQRKKFINLHESQKQNMATMYNNVCNAINALKGAEHKQIEEYKKKNNL